MSIVELIPLDKGNRLILDDTIVTTIGRTHNIGCLDKKISRNHAELFIKSDGTVWIKPIHHNPTFYKTKTNQLVTLTKDEEFQLNDSDDIGLLPNEYFYRISIKSKELTDSSTIPKSPIQEEESSPIKENETSPVKENELSPIKSHEEDKSPVHDQGLISEGGIILHTARSLPVWMATGSVPESKPVKGRGKGKAAAITPTKSTPSPSKYRTYIGRKLAEGVVYEDDEESNEAPAAVTTDAPTNQNGQSSLTVTNSTKRERCPYGKFCYRKNPTHREEAIHPGDPDWDNKENDTNDKKPECPYGSDCYRKNPDHFNEYDHTQKGSLTKQRTSKRKGSDNDDDEDDDDGLPNEYDYHDGFIDDNELDDSARIDRAGSNLANPDSDWKPHKKARHSDDDDENNSSDDSELNLLKEEAAGFVQGSSIHHQRPAKTKARALVQDDDD